MAIYRQRPRGGGGEQAGGVASGLSQNLRNGDGVADITYILMRRNFLYLVALMDWAARKVDITDRLVTVSTAKFVASLSVNQRRANDSGSGSLASEAVRSFATM